MSKPSNWINHPDEIVSYWSVGAVQIINYYKNNKNEIVAKFSGSCIRVVYAQLFQNHKKLFPKKPLYWWFYSPRR